MHSNRVRRNNSHLSRRDIGKITIAKGCSQMLLQRSTRTVHQAQTPQMQGRRKILRQHWSRKLGNANVNLECIGNDGGERQDKRKTHKIANKPHEQGGYRCRLGCFRRSCRSRYARGRRAKHFGIRRVLGNSTNHVYHSHNNCPSETNLVMHHRIGRHVGCCVHQPDPAKGGRSQEFNRVRAYALEASRQGPPEIFRRGGGCGARNGLVKGRHKRRDGERGPGSGQDIHGDSWQRKSSSRMIVHRQSRADQEATDNVDSVVPRLHAVVGASQTTRRSSSSYDPRPRNGMDAV